MQDFEIKDSCKCNFVENFEFYLTFLKIRRLLEGKTYQRKFPYEKYEDFYKNNSNIFSSCNQKLKNIIDIKNIYELRDSDCLELLNEFNKRCISFRIGNRENWLMSFFFFLSFFMIIFIISALLSRAFVIVGVGAILFSIFFTLLLCNYNIERVILGKQKDPRKCVLYFPVRTKELFYKIDQLYKILSNDDMKVFKANLSEEEKNLLEELVDEKKIEKRNNKYYLIDDLTVFLEWLAFDSKGKVYSDELKTKFICENILQKTGATIKDKTVWETKSRNKNKRKDYLD